MNLPRRALWVVRWIAQWWPRGTDGRDPVTWIWKAWRERAAPGGKVLAGIWLLTLPVSVITRGYAGGMVLAAASALLVSSMTLSILPPRGRAKALLPGSMREGETISVIVELETPDGLLPKGTGAWIFRSGDGLVAGGDGVLARDGTGSGTAVEVPLRAVRRGLHLVEGATLLRLEPLGLFRSRRLCPDPGEVAVLPRAAHVVSMEGLLRGPGESEMARAVGGRAAGETEIVGIRPWNDGDGPRDVHHRSWARTGRLAALERLPQAGDGVALVFDSRGSGFRRSLLESAISLCAGVARFLDDNGSLAEFTLDGTKVDLSGMGKLRSVELALAALPPSIDWKRSKAKRPRCQIPTTRLPAIVVGYSADFPSSDAVAQLERRIWVDWSDRSIPQGTIRMDPGSIHRGEVGL